jgi:hypothetical protein
MNFLGGNKSQEQGQDNKSGGGLMGKVNDTLGGGQAGEQKEGKNLYIYPKRSN